MNKKLPNKAHELLTIALDDLKKAQADPKYKINMGFWRKMDYIEKKCVVCLAGSVVAFTLKDKDLSKVCPSDFDSDTKNKLLALDAFRRGYFSVGLRYMGIDHKKERYWEIPEYGENPALFFARMRRMARVLKKENV